MKKLKLEIEQKEKILNEKKPSATSSKSEKDLQGEIQQKEANLKEKIAQIESGVFVHYSVLIGFLLGLIPNYIIMKCFCPGKKKVDWDSEVEQLRKEVTKEESRLDIELKKVMDERKSLESKIEQTPGCQKIKISDIIEGKD